MLKLMMICLVLLGHLSSAEELQGEIHQSNYTKPVLIQDVSCDSESKELLSCKILTTEENEDYAYVTHPAAARFIKTMIDQKTEACRYSAAWGAHFCPPTVILYFSHLQNSVEPRKSRLEGIDIPWRGLFFF